jgi:hypothetical protein
LLYIGANQQQRELRMDERIEVSTERIGECICNLNKKEFTTADVLREYPGRFCSDTNTDVNYSFNAQFGKILSRNQDKLKIKKLAADIKIQDDFGNQTTTSKWQSLSAKVK